MAMDYYTHIHNKPEKSTEEEEDDNDNDDDDDDYIDMEVKSFTHFFPKKTNPIPSPQHGLEFEFHMSTSSTNVERDSTTSPADELFYKGKLLPLHLPPRLQMVEKLLQDAPLSSRFETPLGTNTATTPTTTTPFESCNVSPVGSSQVSRELCSNKGYFVIDEGFVKKSWAKRIKIRIKTLFGKSDNGFSNVSKDITKNELKEEIVSHRKSFSSAFKRRPSMTKVSSSYSSVIMSSSSGSSSSPSSVSSALGVSNGVREMKLKRSNSANSEIETSLIQGAIAHCKQSQLQSQSQSQQSLLQSRRNLSEVGCHSFPSRFVAFDDQDSVTKLCRG
ncbi:hypothetical protein RND81_10G185200 [Saponaria officinalis]|uniref:Membrane-associated kinase regulator 4 n=1 Tax=Saponaria officinalis TaxID=3572 RepID=A0AAW1I673_SAPOF